MPYPISENFSSGIPVGFAQVGGNGTGFSATYNSTAQAADLVFGSNQTFWHLLQATFETDFWFEFDVELIGKTATPWYVGAFLYSNTTTSATGNYEGHRLTIHDYSGSLHGWHRSSFTNALVQYDTNLASAQFFEDWMAVGARKVLRFDARRAAGANNWLVQASRDGVPVMSDLRADRASLRPAIYGFGISLRIHRVSGAIGSSLPEPLPTTRGDAVALRNHHLNFSGGGRVVGTVKRVGDLPVARRVCLLDERTRVVVAETWSNPLTGAYTFDQVSTGRAYTVMSYDHTGVFNAVVASGVQATPVHAPWLT
jgi:hypothetical protein